MSLQKIIFALLTVLIVALAATIYWAWKAENRLRTVTAFVERSVLADAITACEAGKSATPFAWNKAANKSVVGLHSYKGEESVIAPSFTLYADGVFCDYDPGARKASVGLNFLDRD